jgi:hypothetical protein
MELYYIHFKMKRKWRNYLSQALLSKGILQSKFLPQHATEELGNGGRYSKYSSLTAVTIYG